jgi:opacity protein-like surface antigen
MKNLQNYKKLITTAISLNLIGTTSLADGFKDGRFFIGASANLEINYYAYSDKIKEEVRALDSLMNQKFEELDKEKLSLKKEFFSQNAALDDFSSITITYTNGTTANLGEYISSLGDKNSLSGEEKFMRELSRFGELVFWNYEDYIDNIIKDPQNMQMPSITAQKNFNNTLASFFGNIGFVSDDTQPTYLLSNKSLSEIKAVVINTLDQQFVRFIHNNNDKKLKSMFLSYKDTLNKYIELKDYKKNMPVFSDNASKLSPSISLMAGYRFDVNRFGFITEAGMDITFNSTIGKISENDIELTKGLSFYLTQKVGYSFFDNNLSYITAGVSFTNYKPKYKGLIKEDNTIAISPILGVGNEYKITKNLNIFAEWNINLASKFNIKDTTDKKIGEMKVSNHSFKIGARYYL